ncbi:MAG: hypothetical protein EZS28_027182 [Streblomastix strix]|uniref:Uncharacterized protein n=1 Tax=Streblomastix strix TaxID=222440 RepID=A0A5J4V3F3_9EUKA|nr:MAG: hypothetical protein EZS28_027182 [Streblomastix strix]
MPPLVNRRIIHTQSRSLGIPSGLTGENIKIFESKKDLEKDLVNPYTLNPSQGSRTGPLLFIDNKGRIIPQVLPRIFTQKEGIKATIPISPTVKSFGIVQI